MKTCQLAIDFLKHHAKADSIVMDAETGLPVKAIYDSLDCTRNLRVQPAVFWFITTSL